MTIRCPGTLFLVVGPSGAGKDALLSHAVRALSETHSFARRVITRPADAGGEAHEAMSVEDFLILQRCGGFLLSWTAHGLHYGIRSGIEHRLTAGRHVVCSVSRSVVGDARQRFRTIVVEVDADPAIRASRLRARGREADSDVALRLHRHVDVQPDVTVRNDGELEDAARMFVRVLSGSRTG